MNTQIARVWLPVGLSTNVLWNVTDSFFNWIDHNMFIFLFRWWEVSIYNYDNLNRLVCMNIFHDRLWFVLTKTCDARSIWFWRSDSVYRLNPSTILIFVIIKILLILRSLARNSCIRAHFEIDLKITYDRAPTCKKPHNWKTALTLPFLVLSGRCIEDLLNTIYLYMCKDTESEK